MKSAILAGALLLTTSLQVAAETPSFNFVDVGYVSNLGGDDEFDGFEIKGNFEISENLYLNAGYTNLSDDNSGPFDVDAEILTAGLGYKTNISEVSTIFAAADYLRVKVNAGGFGSNSESGYQVGVGVRSNVSESLELRAAGYYRDIVDDDTFVQVGAVYKLAANTGVFLDIESDFDDTRYGVGVRFLFGN